MKATQYQKEKLENLIEFYKNRKTDRERGAVAGLEIALSITKDAERHEEHNTLTKQA